MSNTYMFREGIEVALPKTAGFKEVRDIDGNEIYFDKDEVVFKPAHKTTIREFRNFVLTNITPYMPPTEGGLEHKCDFPGTRSESDNFVEQFTMTVNLSTKIWREVAC